MCTAQDNPFEIDLLRKNKPPGLFLADCEREPLVLPLAPLNEPVQHCRSCSSSRKVLWTGGSVLEPFVWFFFSFVVLCVLFYRFFIKKSLFLIHVYFFQHMFVHFSVHLEHYFHTYLTFSKKIINIFLKYIF